MSLNATQLQLVIAMMFSGIFIAMWLASKKSIIIDFIVALLVLSIMGCALFQIAVFVGIGH